MVSLAADIVGASRTRTHLSWEPTGNPHPADQIRPSDRHESEPSGARQSSLHSQIPRGHHASLLQLQRTAGNQATTRLLLSSRVVPTTRAACSSPTDPQLAAAIQRQTDTLAHVPQRAPAAVQCDPDKDRPAARGKAAGSGTSGAAAGIGPDLALPWSHGDSSLFEVTISGVRVLVGVAAKEEKATRSAAALVAPKIAADNAKIADQDRRVQICFITPTITRFALWKGRPVLMLDPKNADRATVAHEMGHAVLDALGRQAAAAGKQGVAALDLRTRITDVFLRLSATKPTSNDNSVGVGITMVDPSFWSPPSAEEHPQSNPDEFFASAKEAYQIDPKALNKSIARATKADPTVAAPAKDMMALLEALYGKGSAPTQKLPQDRQAATEKISFGLPPNNIEDTAALSPLLNLLISPDTRPSP